LNNINIDHWKSLQFCHSHSFNGIYFSHANPYKINDWRYLNTTEDYSLALDKLKEMSINLGVFGHTHRRRIFIEGVGGERGFNNESDVVLNLLNNKNNGVLNVGSIGQPRGEQESTISWLNVNDREIIIETKHFKYDIKSYLRKVDNLQMTAETKTKIKSYFEA
jgi:diadenosine tetraphosphatase ApaH/serine/threonine PP2A family protein phosphatase